MYTVLRRYEQEVVTVRPETPVWEIADAMDEHSIGCVVVTGDAGNPLGIVTDRDLVLRVVAPGRDPEKTLARDVMTAGVVTAAHDDRLPRVIELMTSRAIRRLPIVKDGRVVSIVSLDDILVELSSDLWNVSEAARIEIREARRTARRRRLREAREEALEELRAQAHHLGQETRDFLRKELSSLVESLRRAGG